LKRGEIKAMNAVFIEKYESKNKPLTQDLYQVSESVSYQSGCEFGGYREEAVTDYVVASRGFIESEDNWEVLVFPSDEHGKILSWLEVYAEDGWHDTRDVISRYLRRLGYRNVT
jgi:hypothetical protein